MQDAAYEEKKPSIITEKIRNLFKSTKTNKLWLIDNESGLLDAYDLIYNEDSGGARFLTFHKQMLQTMCVFQKSTVTAIQRLLQDENPHVSLFNYGMAHDPVLKKVLPNYNVKLIRRWFHQRLAEVYKWINQCASWRRKSTCPPPLFPPLSQVCDILFSICDRHLGISLRQRNSVQSSVQCVRLSWNSLYVCRWFFFSYMYRYCTIFSVYCSTFKVSVCKQCYMCLCLPVILVFCVLIALKHTFLIVL